MTQRRLPAIPEINRLEDFWQRPGETVGATRACHGDVFRLPYLAGNAVCTTGLEAHKTFLVEETAKLSSGAGWREISLRSAAIGNGVLFLDGAEHHWFRQVVALALRPEAVAALVPTIHDIARARISAWPAVGEIGLYREIRAIAFEVAVAAILGVRNAKKVRELDLIFFEIMFAPAPQSIQTFRARLAHALRPIIDARAKNPANDVLSRLLAAGAPDGKPLSDDDVRSHVNTLLVAGHFTTSALCSSLLHMLACHPAYLDRVVEEQSTIEGDDFENIQGMPVLDRALTEAQRLVSPAPHLPRVVDEELEFQGHLLVPGELVFCSVAGTHRDPNLFPEPDRFDPDRFAPPRNEHLRHPLVLAAFGSGPRACPGFLLARTTIKIIVRHVVRAFELDPKPDAGAVWSGMPLRYPITPMLVKLRRRGNQAR
jgi:cytochrome P450